MLPGVPNAAIARLAERAGFDAVYISGAGMANATAGVPDIGLLSMTEVVRLAGGCLGGSRAAARDYLLSVSAQRRSTRISMRLLARPDSPSRTRPF